MDVDAVLGFWFDPAQRPNWFGRSELFDRQVRDRLLGGYEAASAGELDGWRDTGRGCVALCILLDQVPRNVFRGTPRAFATDALALAVTRHALDRGLDAGLTAEERQFLYLPLMHAEVVECQRLCLSLFRAHVPDPDGIGFAERHLEIIERFGRFPHRNAVLGRATTAEEEAFLTEPNSSF